MKRFFTLVLGLLAACATQAQAPDAVASERSRIAAERAAADTRYAQEEKACFAKFAVSDCQNDAKARRREALADLRRQEVSLNDAQRKRKGADRLRSIEEKAELQRQERETQERATAAQNLKAREEKATQKAADRAATDAKRTPRAPKSAEGNSNLARLKAAEPEARRKYEERMKEAQARRDAAAKKQKERTKPLANSLVVPP